MIAREGWRADRLAGGVVIDVAAGEVIGRGLALPHSPRCIDGQLYLLLSARGEFVRLDPGTGGTETLTRLPGLARRLARWGDYVFAGVSRLCPNHKFGDLPG